MKKYAFTLAEVLITLAVVGVVSAMTLPVLINKINDMQYDRARQKALASIGEAGRIIAVQGNINSAIDAKDFVENYLSKQLKIAKYCGTTLTDCGFSDTVNKMGKSGTVSIPTTIGGLNTNLNAKTLESYAILTGNGYSVNLYYNPACRIIADAGTTRVSPITSYRNFTDNVCINAIYDMNGKRGPNEVGKDIGWVTVIGNDETAVAVAPTLELTDASNTYQQWSNANKLCSSNNTTLPSWQELESAIFNLFLTNLNGAYWSSSRSNGGYWFFETRNNWIATRNSADFAAGQKARCIRR